MYNQVNQMWEMWGMGTGMWFWIIIIGGVLYYFYGSYRPKRMRYTEDPLEVAQMRYARGEITLEEFEEIKRNLS